jgi:hypothetical protein
MAEVTKFTGYLASDGSTHHSMKAAVAKTTEIKVKAALKEFSDKHLNATTMIVNEPSESGDGYIDLATFLYVYKDAITEAFNQSVILRSPRKPKVKKDVSPLREDAAVAQ